MFFHEVVDYNTGAVHDKEYFSEGWVTEFRYGTKVRDGADDFGNLRSVYDQGWGMSPPDQAFIFVDNQDNQRGGGQVLSFKDGDRYKRASAFTLAYNYGFTRVMSSYNFNNRDDGPPHNSDFSTKKVTINPDGSCGNGWVCEHRWRPIGNMARFRTAVANVTQVSNWNTDNDVLSFNRGNRGFFAMGKTGFSVTRQTGMAPGQYCDLISDCKVKVNVDGSGNAQISPADQNDPFVAIIVRGLAKYHINVAYQYISVALPQQWRLSITVKARAASSINRPY
ncbi:alpha-amylase [Elysia marginata]|uniref:alpha-amylase n=1 Tax=Elysia marginata TaxID=1093978 RepID=A0AAV4FA45_9GAST|nr:alpha-amylase [Elysia marginata]